MDLTTAIALSRLMAQERDLAVTANNLANANTPGYKATKVLFSDWLERQSGTTAPPGGRVIAFTQDRATWRDPHPGAISQTGNPLDVALTGHGYFTVQAPSGPLLTRDGRFSLAPGGTLTDSSGDKVLDTSGQPIQLSPSDTTITIAADGTISSENGKLGQIGVVRPTRPMAMQAVGATLFSTSAPTAPVRAPHIVQGAIEGSNVQPITELTHMMNSERQFQFVTQLVQAESDRHQGAIDKLLPPQAA